MLYILLTCLLFILHVNYISCDNITSDYMFNNEFKTRQSRLLTFNTLKDGDINVELAFNVPFLRVPIKKSIDEAKGAIANINLGAVILAGAMVFGIAVIIPGILIFFTKKMFVSSTKPYRIDESVSSFPWSYMNVVDDVLMKNNLDVTSCIQQMVCKSVKHASKNVLDGKSTSVDKIIDGLATNEWVQKVIYETAIYTALNDGLDRMNCGKKYGNCKITQQSIQILLKKFITTINNIS